MSIMSKKYEGLLKQYAPKGCAELKYDMDYLFVSTLGRLHCAGWILPSEQIRCNGCKVKNTGVVIPIESISPLSPPHHPST